MYDFVFVHLLNDFSGSPKVLAQTINAAKKHGNACLYVGSSGTGFLSNCGVETKRYFYIRTGNRWMTLITYLVSQLVLFFRLAIDQSIGKNTIIYVNTLLPFAAGILGRMRGVKVIYHIHEVSITPRPLRQFLTAIAEKTSDLNIYVSHAHMAALPVRGAPSVCLYNALEPEFAEKAAGFSYRVDRDGAFRVLMLASLRDYKGLNEFLELADSLGQTGRVEFDLVLNDETTAVDKWINERNPPANITVHPRTFDTAKFFESADVLLNLSRVDQWVETFGLTILEAMAYGIPVIVPPVGGPAELVTDGVEGFLVDSRDSTTLRSRLLQLRDDSRLRDRMSNACSSRAADFKPEIFDKELVLILDKVRRL